MTDIDLRCFCDLYLAALMSYLETHVLTLTGEESIAASIREARALSTFSDRKNEIDHAFGAY